MKRLEGRKALVTGAGKTTGIGFAIAKKLASEGADIIVADLVRQMDKFEGYLKTSDADLMDEAVATLRKIGVRAEGVPLDVTDSASVRDMGESVKEKFGSLDILVNNAGGSPGVSTLLQMTEEAWRYNIELNMNGALWVTRAVHDILKDGASIINTSSRAGKVPSAFMGAYCTAKAGLIMLTKVMALEFSSRRIRVNAICPGQIDTELWRWSAQLKAFAEQLTVDQYKEKLAASLPAKRIGLPEDVADVVCFLAGDEASYLTGQAINVTGGQLMEF